MNEVFIPPDAIEDAVESLKSIYSDDAAARNTRREMRWSTAVWRGAVRKALELHPIQDGKFVNQPPRSVFDLSFTFFLDLETKYHGAMLTSEWECLTIEDRAYAKKIDPSTLDPSTRSILRARALDKAAEGL